MRPELVPILLFVFLALQPLSTDLYLPSLPSIASNLNASSSQMQLTLSLFVAAFASCQLVVGPITDRFGRKIGIGVGLLLYLIGSALCALAPTIQHLIAGRVVQGLAVGAIVVSGRAIFRDSYEPEEGARRLANVYSWIGIVPFFAPLIGSLLLMAFAWQSGFWAVFTMGTAIAVFTALNLKESNQFKNPKALDPLPIVKNYWHVFSNGEFQKSCGAIGGSFAGLFCFLSGSSFVLITQMSLSPFQYAMGFSLTCLGYMLGTRIASRLLPKRGTVGTCRLAVFFNISGALSMLGVAVFMHQFAWLNQPAAFFLSMFCYLIGHGMLQPCCQNSAIAPFPRTAGAAAALLGFLMNVLAAFVGFAVSLVFNQTAVPMAIAMCLCAVLTFCCAYLLKEPT